MRCEMPSLSPIGRCACEMTWQGAPGQFTSADARLAGKRNHQLREWPDFVLRFRMLVLACVLPGGARPGRTTGAEGSSAGMPCPLHLPEVCLWVGVCSCLTTLQSSGMAHGSIPGVRRRMTRRGSRQLGRAWRRTKKGPGGACGQKGCRSFAEGFVMGAVSGSSNRLLSNS